MSVGPELISGSTRLKAGTAQKLVLNTISTVAMIRLGRTFGNLMVGVAPANAKLRDRLRQVVATATGAPDERVDAALEASGGDGKVAVVVAPRRRRHGDARSRGCAMRTGTFGGPPE